MDDFKDVGSITGSTFQTEMAAVNFFLCTASLNFGLKRCDKEWQASMGPMATREAR